MDEDDLILDISQMINLDYKPLSNEYFYYYNKLKLSQFMTAASEDKQLSGSFLRNRATAHFAAKPGKIRRLSSNHVFM